MYSTSVLYIYVLAAGAELICIIFYMCMHINDCNILTIEDRENKPI